MEIKIDLEEIRECEKCGILFNYKKKIISEKKLDWYGTDVKYNCPFCGKIHEENLGDGY